MKTLIKTTNVMACVNTLLSLIIAMGDTEYNDIRINMKTFESTKERIDGTTCTMNDVVDTMQP